MSKKLIVLISLVLLSLVIVVSGVVYFLKSIKTSSEDISSTNETNIDQSEQYQTEIAIKDSDVYVGSKDSIVTVISYDSYTCPHCANFYKEIYPKIKSEYIDKGLVKFIHRDFPTDKIALDISQIVECYKAKNKDKTNEQILQLITSIYLAQESWISSKDPIDKVSGFFKLSAFSKSEIKKCLNDESYIYKAKENLERISKNLNIKGTPTVFINGVRNDSPNTFDIISDKIQYAYETQVVKDKSDLNKEESEIVDNDIENQTYSESYSGQE